MPTEEERPGQAALRGSSQWQTARACCSSFSFPLWEGERSQEQAVKEASVLFAHNSLIIGGSNKSFAISINIHPTDRYDSLLAGQTVP